MSSLIDNWRIYMGQLKDWLAGSPTGGPNGDGKYPLTDSSGTTYYVACPAAMEGTVAGTVGSAEAHAADALAASLVASGARVDALAAQAVTLSYRDAAIAARDLASTYASTAGTHAANALVYKNQAEAAASSVTTKEAAVLAAAIEVEADRVAADAARVAAQTAAAAAATFDPANFYTKTAADARYRLQSTTVTWGELSGKPTTFTPSAHTHAWADITSGKPTTLGGYGITDPVVLTTAAPQFTGGEIRIQGYAGNAASGVLRLGSGSGYIWYNPSGVFEFNHAAGTSYLNAAGGIWTSGNFNPANYQPYRPEVREVAETITDWNNAVNNGWYMASGGLNAPAAFAGSWVMGKVTRHNADWLQQEVWVFTGNADGARWRRHKTGGTWGAWTADIIVGAINAGNIVGRDITASRGDGTGVIFLNAAQNKYLYFDNTKYVLPGADLAVDGQVRGTSLTPTNANGATLTGNYGGIQANGFFYTTSGHQQLTADSAAWVRAPRIFVGGSDPGAKAADGDIWIP
jgi:hypothetical protein